MTRLIDPARALLALVFAYVAVSTVGFGVYLVVAELMGHSPWDAVDIRDNDAYQRVAMLLPLLNLAVWTGAARWYFAGRRLRYPAWPLGISWLAIAVLLDYLIFIVPDHALALDSASFYFGQGPWIYLTYIAVAVSAFLGRWWAKRAHSQSNARHNERLMQMPLNDLLVFVSMTLWPRFQPSPTISKSGADPLSPGACNMRRTTLGGIVMADHLTTEQRQQLRRGHRPIAHRYSREWLANQLAGERTDHG